MSSKLTETDLLLEMYKVQVARSEHYERLRASLSTLVLAVAAALVGFAASTVVKAGEVPILSGAIILLGAFGFFASQQHAKRAKRHGDRAAAYRKALTELAPQIGTVRDVVASHRTHLNLIWSSLHLGIAAVGLAIGLIRS